MLKSYEAIYENGQVQWLGEKPEINHARLIVTVLDEPQKKTIQYRTFPIPEAGELEILGDIVNPIVDEEDWECLK